jgi:flagellar motor switch/type III secretory pathway protein FliN
MLEQVSTSVKFLAFFTAGKTGKTGLTVTIDIYNPSGTQIVTAGSATALGGGLYAYTLSTDNSSEGEYAAIFKTSDSTVDAQHIPSLWVLGRAGVENLDAATSTRLPSSSYNAAPSVSDIRTELSVELGRIDASVSSRSTLTTGDLPSVPSAASVASAVRTELTEISNLDASVSSRLADADYTAPTSAPTAAAVASAVRTELTEISNLDASVSSRLASASYTAPANSDITAIKSKTDNLPASPAAVADIPTTAQIATAVEGSLLNEADGQAVLNAIVSAIGNQNLSEVSLVAAVRADLERVGGKIDSIPTDSAPSAASVATAVWSASTKEITGGTVTTLTNSPDVPTEAEIASQVRTELSVELGRIDAAVSSRLAPSGTLATVTTLTNAPTVPTAAAIADEVRVELATELARIDAPVSGATAPSAATVATAVRSELATELARVDQAVSSRLAGSAYTAPANSDVAAIKVKTDALVVERLNNCATTAIVGNLLAQANS